MRFWTLNSFARWKALWLLWGFILSSSSCEANKSPDTPSVSGLTAATRGTTDIDHITLSIVISTNVL